MKENQHINIAGLTENLKSRIQIIHANKEEQVKYLVENIPGFTEKQAKFLLDEAYKRNSSVVLGGSRIRGDYKPDSDLDVGFGNLSRGQAKRTIKKVNKKGPLNLESHIQIVPGHKTNYVPEIKSPEEFFQRAGIRISTGRTDPREGEPYLPSGSITVTPDGEIIVIPAER